MIIGELIEIGKEELLPNALRKVTIVIREEGPFPSEIPMEVFNEKITMLAKLKVNDRVWIRFRPRGFCRINDDGKEVRWVSLRPYRIELYDPMSGLQTELPANEVQTGNGEDQEIIKT